ncbi:anaerobic ribonucleoside-triphosphate reductase activating protein [Patescibacteria group bacterium]|nr:anaerobic ribonucleoside-triphosphate reductase activating protein [Patescibacteria group bacterium]
MHFGGWQRFSMIDYPDKICAIGFTQGCNFRCPFCHNPELVEPELFNDAIAEEKILDFLQERIGKIDGVTITGGEPTLHNDLLGFIKKVKSLGFLVKLDTNGSRPEKIQEIINDKAVDYIAMDIKGPEEKYAQIARAEINLADLRKSIEMIMSSGIPYEFRTTVVTTLLNKEDIIAIGRMIFGARLYVLQKFLPTKTIDPDYLQEDTYSDEELEGFKSGLSGLVKRCIIR